MNRLALAALSAAALLSACAAPRPAPAPQPPPAPPPVARAAAPAAPGLDLAIVKTAASPCQDFYEYACGGWIEKTEIPADQSRWVRSFNVMQEENKAKLRTILDGAAAGKVDPQDRYGQLVADLYAACMDEGAVEKSGLTQLQAEWKAIEAVKDAKSLARVVGRLHAETVPAVLRPHLDPGRQGLDPGHRRPLPGRALAAGPRLLHRRPTRRAPPSARTSWRTSTKQLGAAGVPAGPGGRRGPGHPGPRDRAGREPLDPRRDARPGPPLQPARPGRPEEGRPALRLGRLPRPRSASPGSPPSTSPRRRCVAAAGGHRREDPAGPAGAPTCAGRCWPTRPRCAPCRRPSPTRPSGSAPATSPARRPSPSAGSTAWS